MQKLTMQDAVERLNKGELLIYPTETFFALGCKASQDGAIARIFQIKRRLLAMPLPLIIADKEQLSLVAQIPASAQQDVEKLQELFWPGALSLILPARMHLSPLLTGGTGNVAIRVSPHPVACELARLTGEPLVSSSANISGRPAAARAEELDSELTSAMGAVLNLPPLPAGGAPSTLVEPLGNGELRILRHGAIDEQSLRNAGFILHLSQERV